MPTTNRDFRVKNGLVVEGSSATVNGNNVLTTASSIDALSDVVITTPATNQVLLFNGTNWVNSSETGDITAVTSGTGITVTDGTGPIPTVAVDTTVVATTNNTLTMSNKTLTSPVISTIVNTGTLTLPTSTDTLVGRATTDTLTNKTINGANNTLTVRLANDITGFGTGVATALAVNVGSAGAFVTFNGALGTPSSATLTNATGLPVSTGISGLGAGIATFLATPSSANLAAAVTDETGSGALVFATSPTLVTPNIGVATGTSFNSITGLSSTTPSANGTAAVGTSTTVARADHVHPTTGLGLTSGTLAQFAATTSSQLAGVISDETGSGALVFATSPTLVTPVLGAATGTSLALTGGSLTTRAAATQDGVILSGRAGGTSTFAVTLTPTTLTASRTLTLPDVTGTVVTTGDTGTVTSTMIADGTIVNADINSSAAIAYSKLALTGSIVNADIGASAAIAYSKLSLTGSIVNADISASAAIAVSKLSASTISGITLGNNLNALTIGTGLSGTSYNGSSAVTIAIDSTVATTSGTQTLTNKTLGSSTTLGANLNANNFTVTSLATPTNSTDAATKQYVDDLAQGLHIHASVVAATTANLTATYSNGSSGVGATLTNSGTLAAFSIDGVSPAQNDRILVKNQSTTFQNGIYTLTTVGSGSVAWVLTRATDFDTPAEMDGGDFVFVTGGTAGDNTGWVQTEIVTTIGTSPVLFTQFSGAGTYLAGNGLTLTGNTFTINTAITADLSSAQTFTNKTINGSSNTITNVSLTTGVTGTLPVANGGTGITSFGTGIATFLGTPSSANLAAAVTDETGSGALVFATSPTLVTPNIGVATGTSFNSITGLSSTTPSANGTAAVGTSTTVARADHVHPTTGLGLTSGTLAQFAATTSSQLAGVISDETGSGSLVFATSPTLVTPVLGAATGTSLALTGGSLTTRAAATQDGVILSGRAGGTSTFAVTLTPTTLTASRTLTLPDVTGTVVTTGDTGTVTSTMILDGTIVNADINASAAIAVSKLAASTISGVTLGNNLNALTIGTGLSGTSYNGSSAVTIAIDSTVATLTGTQTLTNKTITATGQIQSTLANNATTGAGQIFLNGATGNRIDFNQNGVAAPAFTTRSAGTKIVLWPNVGASTVDYAIGIEGSHMWHSIDTASSANGFKWYAATTNVMTLRGNGTLSLNTTSSTLGSSSATHQFGVVSGSASNVVMVIRAAASQTADLQQWQNDTGTVRAAVGPFGELVAGGGTPIGRFTVYALTASSIGAVIRGAASQTANLQEWQNSAGTVLASMSAAGAFSAVTKSFDIEHPTKEGMRLRYGSLEGPENGVYVRGRSKEKTIELPDYWTGLVDEDTITVNLTAIGSGTLYVKEVIDNTVIVGGTAKEFFFTVFGERKDVDKLIVEY